MSLETFWFIVVAFFWTGFFVLEGFDFGVGVLHTIVGATRRTAAALKRHRAVLGRQRGLADRRRRGHVRGVPGLVRDAVLRPVPRAAADPGRADRARRRRSSSARRSRRRAGSGTWTWATTLGSGALPLLLGIGLGGMVAGFPIDADGEYTGGVRDIFTAYGVWTGLTLLSLSVLHGATFLALKTDGAGARARRAPSACACCLVALVASLGFAVVVARRC